MPLPDERPRQSVANLIGRFEQQNKRNSLSNPIQAPGLPRSSSVNSHLSGDAAKEEAKERREWPPKATSPPPDVARSPPSVTSPRSSILKVNATNAILSPRANEATASSPLQSPVGSPPTSTRSIDHAVTRSSENGTGSEKSAKPSAATKSVSSAKSAAKPMPTTPKKQIGGTLKAMSSSTSGPIRSQHTGPSTSTNTTHKSATAPKPTIPSTPKTPARSKTPTVRPKTPTSTMRSKTPSTTRPKTPSSGLFAPTAASLARSKSGIPQGGTSVKKSPSTGASDRLSKPTAASLSKARPSLPSSTQSTPSRASVKTPAPRSTATPKAIVKPRVGLTPAKTGLVKEKVAATTTAGKADITAEPTVVVGDIPSEEESSPHESSSVAHSEEHVTSGSEVDHEADVLSSHEPETHEEISVLLDEEAHSIGEDSAEHEVSIEENHAHDETTSAAAAEEAVATHVTKEEELQTVTPGTGAEEHDIELISKVEDVIPHAPDVVSQEETQNAHLEEDSTVKSHPSPVCDDLEDLVNLLESKPRPVSMIPSEEDVVDIPDEE